MALADTAKLVVDLSLKGNFTRGIGKAIGGLDQLDRKASRGYRIGQQIGTGIQRGAALAAVGVGLLAFQVGRGLESLVGLEQQTAQTSTVIKSTKGVAGITAAEVGRLSEKFEGLNATVGDEFIRGAQNMLLTFTDIRGKAFEPTLKAVLDMNTALGKGPEGLTSTAIQVGKALQDPSVGLTALRRVGVSFSKEQVKRIKALQEEGKLYEAQKIILAELDQEFGGSFLAQGGTTAGKVAKFHDAIEDLQRTLASGMLPVVSNVADALTELFQDPTIQKGVAEFGKDLAEFFTPARIKEGIGALKDVATTIGGAFRAAAGAIGPLIDAFSKLPPDLRNLLIGAVAVNKITGGLVTNVAGGLAGAIGSALKTIVAGNVTVIGSNVVTPGAGVPGPPGVPGKGLADILKTGLALTIAGAIVAVAVPIGKAFADALPAGLKGPGGEGKTDSQRAFEAARAAIAVQAAENRKLAQVALAAQRDEETGRTAAKLQRIADTMLRANALRDDERGRGKAPGASTRTENEIRELANKLSPLKDHTGTVIPGAIASLQESSLASIAKLGTNVTTEGLATRTTTARGNQLIANTTRSASLVNAQITASATRSSAASIVAAIYAARPVVNVTQVTRNTTIQQRYGPSSGSQGNDSGNRDQWW